MQTDKSRDSSSFAHLNFATIEVEDSSLIQNMFLDLLGIAY